MQTAIKVIAGISGFIGLFVWWASESLLWGLGIGFGAFLGISQVVGPALDPRPNIRDTPELRELKNARNLQTIADELTKRDQQDR